MTKGFYSFEFIWFDLVSKMRDLIKEYTEGIFEKITENNMQISKIQQTEEQHLTQIKLLEKIVFDTKEEEGGNFDVFDKIERRIFKLEKIQEDIENKVDMKCTQLIATEFKELRFQMEKDRENRNLLVSHSITISLILFHIYR